MGKCWALNADGTVCGADSLGYCDPKEWPPQKKYCAEHCPEGGLSRTNAKRVWDLLGPDKAKCEHLSRAWAATIARAPRKKRVPLAQDAAVAAGSMPAQPSSQLSSQPSSSQHATTTLVVTNTEVPDAAPPLPLPPLPPPLQPPSLSAAAAASAPPLPTPSPSVPESGDRPQAPHTTAPPAARPTKQPAEPKKPPAKPSQAATRKQPMRNGLPDEPSAKPPAKPAPMGSSAQLRMTRSSDPTDPFVQRMLTEPQPECHQPPSLIDTADLGREPEVVLRCGGLLAGRAFTAQRIYDALPKGLQAEAMYKTPLDLLSETQLQPDVIALAALLVKPGGQPTQTMIALCNELKVNAEPAVGMLELGHLTPPHQHTMGALNMAGRQVVKTWWFWPPSFFGPSLGSGRSVRPSESDRASAIRLEQFEGDVIWIPLLTGAHGRGQS